VVFLKEYRLYDGRDPSHEHNLLNVNGDQTPGSSGHGVHTTEPWGSSKWVVLSTH
jgi:hypothetical protein